MVEALVLAAGSSTRMPGHKLLLELGGRTVIEHTVDQLLASRVRRVIVVLGYRAAEVQAVLARRPLTLALNSRYAQGLSTSLQCGLALVDDRARGVLCCLGDQPLVTSAVIDKLLQRFARTEAPVVAPFYRGQRGNPVLFHRKTLPLLARIEGDRGGREVVDYYGDRLEKVETDCPGVVLDIDRPPDLQKARALLAIPLRAASFPTG